MNLQNLAASLMQPSDNDDIVTDREVIKILVVSYLTLVARGYQAKVTSHWVRIKTLEFNWDC